MHQAMCQGNTPGNTPTTDNLRAQQQAPQPTLALLTMTHDTSAHKQASNNSPVVTCHPHDLLKQSRRGTAACERTVCTDIL